MCKRPNSVRLAESRGQAVLLHSQRKEKVTPVAPGKLRGLGPGTARRGLPYWKPSGKSEKAQKTGGQKRSQSPKRSKGGFWKMITDKLGVRPQQTILKKNRLVENPQPGGGL